MLAQAFKTSAELEISDAEFDALRQVLGMLERGELQHVEAHEDNAPRPDSATMLFNMVDYWTVCACGTAACIAGTSDLMFGTDFCARYEPWPLQLADLFAPGRPVENYNDVTTAQAAAALRSYLTHGEPRWKEALGKQ